MGGIVGVGMKVQEFCGIIGKGVETAMDIVPENTQVGSPVASSFDEDLSPNSISSLSCDSDCSTIDPKLAPIMDLLRN